METPFERGFHVLPSKALKGINQQRARIKQLEVQVELINLGPAGHINPQSGYGPWPRGLSILRDQRHERIEFIPERHRNDDFYRQLGDF